MSVASTCESTDDASHEGTWGLDTPGAHRPTGLRESTHIMTKNTTKKPTKKTNPALAAVTRAAEAAEERNLKGLVFEAPHGVVLQVEDGVLTVWAEYANDERDLTARIAVPGGCQLLELGKE